MKRNKSQSTARKVKKRAERKKKNKTIQQNSSTNDPPQQRLIRLFEHYQNGRLNVAEQLASSLTIDFPKHQFGWKVLGEVLKQTGRLEESLTANQRSLELVPQDAEAHNNLGNTLDELGRLDDAVRSFARAIALNPEFAEAHFSLGVTLKKLGRINDAIASYNRAIVLRSDYAEAHTNLGSALKDIGKLNEALTSFSKVIALRPDLAEAHDNLGSSLKELGRFNEAIASYNQAIALNPDFAEAHSNLGNTLIELGRLDQATASFAKAMKLKPDWGQPQHMHAALTGVTTTSAPRDYVENLFDDYATHFDHSLVDKLEYDAPKVIARMLLENSESDSLGSIVDLGCGTGIFGTEINQYCDYLEGVDLSEKMLEKANEKEIYNKLVKQDIVDYLANTVRCFDMYVLTDVVIYIGELSEIFRLIKLRNKKGARLVFSTEDYDGDGYILRQSGRYSHSKTYIQELCEEFGYELCHVKKETIRKDNNQSIRGGLYILKF